MGRRTSAAASRSRPSDRMKSTEQFDVIVVADDSHRVSIGDLARRLEEAGLVVTGVLESVAMVIGRADSQTIDAVSRLEGVAAVEKSRIESAIDKDT